VSTGSSLGSNVPCGLAKKTGRKLAQGRVCLWRTRDMKGEHLCLEDDVLTQLERLGALKAQGLFTDQEFAAAKQKPLAS
jgi:hypothetical protein